MPNIEKTGRQAQEKAQEIFSTASSVSISQAFMYFIEAWKKYFVFSGRSNRMMFWSFVCFNLIISCFIGLVVGAQGAGVYSFLSFSHLHSKARIQEAEQLLPSRLQVLLYQAG